MIDHNISDRFDPVLQKGLKHGTMLLEPAVTVVDFEKRFWIVSGADFARVGRGRKPNQVEPAFTNGGSLFPYNIVPLLLAKGGKLVWVTVSMRLPIEALQHNAIVAESCLSIYRTLGNSESDQDKADNRN
jgi:hypothetical protein